MNRNWQRKHLVAALQKIAIKRFLDAMSCVCVPSPQKTRKGIGCGLMAEFIGVNGNAIALWCLHAVAPWGG
jgi:hypothetical protein